MRDRSARNLRTVAMLLQRRIARQGGPAAERQAGRPGRGRAAPVEPDLGGRRAQDQGAAGDRHAARDLPVDEPGPHRAQRRLDQQEQRHLEGGHVAHGRGQQEVRQPDLDDAQVDDQRPVAGVARQRQGPREADREGDQVAGHGRPGRGLDAALLPAHPAEPEKGRRPGHAGDQGQGVAEAGPRRGLDGLLGAERHHRQPGDDHEHHGDVGAAHALVEQHDARDQHVERGGALQEDRVGRRGLLVRQDEQDHGRRVGGAHDPGAAGPVAAGAGHGHRDHGRGHPRPQRGDLQRAPDPDVVGGLDGGPARGEQGRGADHLQPRETRRVGHRSARRGRPRVEPLPCSRCARPGWRPSRRRPSAARGRTGRRRCRCPCGRRR